MKLLVALLFISGHVIAQGLDGVWANPTGADFSRFASATLTAYRIVGEEVHFLHAYENRDGITFDARRPDRIYTSTEGFISDSVRVRRENGIERSFCVTTFGSAQREGNTIVVQSFDLEKQVMFGCPRSRALSARGDVGNPVLLFEMIFTQSEDGKVEVQQKRYDGLELALPTFTLQALH